MNLIDLLQLEIRNLFPKLESYPTESIYNVYCSKAFAEGLMKSFLSIGFEIPTTLSENIPEVTVEAIQEGKVRFTKYQVPTIGYLVIHADLEQGYRIQKVSNVVGSDEYKGYKFDKHDISDNA